VPRNLKVEAAAEVEMPVTSVPQEVDGNARKQKFWDKFKNNLIDLFKEEEDQVIK
jgi:cell division protein FtsA